jgi:hypothetical protein
MIKPINNPRDNLFVRIAASIEKGGRLTGAVLAYVETALFPPAPERLAAFLSDDTDCERDSLLDLIFSPDQAVQVDLEPLLEVNQFSVGDEAALLERLIARSIHAPVTMPDGSPLVSVRIPDFIKSQYLERLNLSWQMDTRVAAAIDTGVPSALGPLVSVRLRNAGIRFLTSQRIFMCRFFERMESSDPEYLACLDLVLSLLQTADEETDAYDLLTEHKRLLFRSRQQAIRFDTLLRQSNIETLMLQGVRAPHASRTELVYHMRLIDLICFGIFGKTETIEPPVEEPLRQVSDLDTPAAAVKSLLR